MLRISIRWVSALLVLIPLSTAAQPADSSALRLDALLQGVAENPTFRAARLNTEAQRAVAPQASAWPDPMVGVSVQPFPILTARGAQRSQWRVEQSIPVPGTRALQGDIATLGADVVRAETRTLAQDLAYDVKQTFYDLYRVQQQAALLDQFEQELRDFEEATATQYEVGRGSQQAVLKAQLERRRLGIRREKLAEEAQSAREALARLLDRPSASLRGTAVVDSVPVAGGAEALLDRALQNRPELAARQTAHEQAERRIALARKAFWPQVSVNATYFDIADRDFSPTATGRDALAVGVGVKIPLSRDRLRAHLDEAELRAREAETRIDAARSAIRTQVGDRRSQMERRQRQLVLLDETLIPQAEAALEATLNAYSAGRTDFLDLLDAERTLFSLQMERIDTYARLLQATAALERAVGDFSLDRALD